MFRLSLRVVALVALTALPAPVFGDDTPFAGRWKATFVRSNDAVSFVIVDLSGTSAKPVAKTVATLAMFDGAKISDLKVDAGSLRFTVASDRGTYQVAAYPPKGVDKPKMLYASFQGKPQMFLGRLELTEQDTLKDRDDVSIEDGFDEFIRFMGKGDETKTRILKEIAKQYGSKPAGVSAAQQLLQHRAEDWDSTEVELRDVSKLLLDAIAPYGRELEVQTGLTAARILLKSNKGLAPAVETAQRAEKLLTDADPPARVAGVLQALTEGLRKSGKAKEASVYVARLDKANHLVDEEYEKTAIPFKPGKFAGRKGKSQRVAVVELFTGAQCPPCVAADIAFDAAIKTYGPGEAIFLQYHLHIPGPDPLVNVDSEARQKYYGNKIGGTPTAFVDGKVSTPMGGAKQNSENSYNALRKVVDEQLEKDAEADLKLDVTRKGDRIEVEVKIEGLKKTGDKVKLRFVLVEDVCRYTGSNGLRLHHHVVRALPGVADGLSLKEATAKQTLSINLAEVRKNLEEYLTEKNKKISSFFSDEDMQTPLKNLRVVALIQNDEDQQILQAAQIKVPAE